MRLFSFILLLLAISPAHALTMEEGDETTLTIEDYIADFVDIPEGGTDWKVFGATGEVEAKAEAPDGYDYYYSKPEFTPEVKALDGKEIKIRGYMFPLDETEEQKNFLFGPFPLSCPYHYHAGPSLVMEVYADKEPVKFDYEAVTLTGTLELVPDDPEYNTFYRLKDAQVSQ